MISLLKTDTGYRLVIGNDRVGKVVDVLLPIEVLRQLYKAIGKVIDKA